MGRQPLPDEGGELIATAQRDSRRCRVILCFAASSGTQVAHSYPVRSDFIPAHRHGLAHNPVSPRKLSLIQGNSLV
jgi:hypothetical protein